MPKQQQQHADLAGHNPCLQSIPGESISVRESMRPKGTRGHPLEVHATCFLSTKLIEREHPVRINHALLRANLADAPF